MNAGPSFARSTRIAIHEPVRAWPWTRARASIVMPAGVRRRGDGDGLAARATHGAAAERDGGRPRSGTATRRTGRGRLRAWCTTPLSRPAPRAACAPDAGPARKVASPGRGRRPRRGTLCAIPPRTGAAQARRTLVPVPLEVACPRSARSARCATTPRRCPISRGWSRRPTTSSRRRGARSWRRATRATSWRSTCRSTPGAADPDEKYRQAARTFAAWRSDGTLRKDRQPSLYVYEQAYTVPGTSARRVQRGFYARLRLEAFGPGAGVLPHERTLAGPKEDRYKLMRATGRQLLGRDGPLRRPDRDGARGCWPRRRRRAAVADVTDDDGVRHRLWMVPDDGADGAARRGPARRGRPRAGHDRRRPPSLRDGAPVPRRAPHDPLGRGGPGLRLRAGALHGHGGRAAARAADAPGGARGERGRRARGRGRRRPACSTWSRPTARRSWRRSGRAARPPARPAVGGRAHRAVDPRRRARC